MFGAFLDAVMQIPKNMHAEEMQDDAQTFNHQQAEINRNFTAGQAEVNRRYAHDEAEQSRIWQEQMSNSAYQRATADMRRAGLNPIMAATRAAGASSPAGAQASGSAATSSAASSGIGSAGHPGTNFAAAQVMEEQKENMRTQRRSEHNLGSLYSQQWNESQARTRFINEQAQTQEETTRRERAQADIATSDAKGRTLEGNIDDTTYGNIMRYINRAVRSITGGASAYRNFRE